MMGFKSHLLRVQAIYCNSAMLRDLADEAKPACKKDAVRLDALRTVFTAMAHSAGDAYAILAGIRLQPARDRESVQS